jgi:glycosyltransferase involved in cell wall biosynthesis
MMNYILKYYGPVRGETVIHNGADPAKYYVSPKDDIVFSMGRLWDEAKNIRLVIEAAGHIKYPVYIAGSLEGREMPEMPANVLMLGYLPPDAIKEWLSRAAIYLLPVKYEPFGYSFLEAALSGSALITGKIGSMREIWEESAVFADTGDSFSLAMLVNGLMADPEHRHLMTVRARERAVSMYTATTMAENYTSLYRRTISSYTTRKNLKLQEQ